MIAAEQYRNLEFDKVLERLAGYAGSELTRQLITGIDVVFHPARIDENLDQTGEALQFMETKPGVERPAFSQLEDITDLLERISAGELPDAQETRQLLRFFSICGELDVLLKHLTLEEFPRLVDCAAAWQSQEQLASQARRTFNEEGEVRDSASPELARVRSKLRQYESEARNALAGVLSGVRERSGEDAVLTIRGNRFVVLVPRALSGVYDGSIVDVSGSGQSVYFEPAAVSAMNAERQHMFLAEDQEVRRILREFTTRIASNYASLKADLAILVKFDYIYSRARFALALKGHRPRFNDNGTLILKDAVHPLLFSSFIPETVIFDRESCLVISGANAGGKTVLLKLMGLYVLLSSLGCFLPGEATLPYISGLAADIGDEQSALANLSTFTAHLQFLKHLWQALVRDATAEHPLLVLIDEIGTGTEPGEGSAFAYGLLESLLTYPVKLAVTTHYDVLKTLAFEREDVKNVCLEFDQEELKPTYRVLDDQPGQSYAFAIAQRWGIDSQVLESASQVLGKEEEKMGAILSELEALRKAAEQKSAEAAKQAAELTRIRARNEELLDELKLAKQQFARHAERVKQQLEQRIDVLLSETKQKLKKKARQSARKRDEFVKAASKSAGVARAQKQEVEHLVADVLEQMAVEARDSLREPAAVSVGDAVIIERSGVHGEVLEVDPDRQEAVLVVMGKRLNVKLDQLRKASQEQAAPPDLLDSYRRGVGRNALGKAEADYVSPSLTTSDTLDLHGQTTEEAQESLDAFLSSCLLAGVPSVRIMHGIGTGRLKAFVQDYLRRHKQVRNVRTAPVAEGGVGITLADL